MSKENEIRLKELDQFMSGVNSAAHIRMPAAGSRMLSIDDVHYYLFNRRRVLKGEKPLTPDAWFEAER